MNRPTRRRGWLAAIALLLTFAPQAALADGHDAGNTAWMLTSTALVLFMTLPGLALFYGGLVRTKNVLSVLMQCLALAAVVTPLWMMFGYGLAFGEDELIPGFLGGFGKAFHAGISGATLSSNGVPEILFSTFQLTFAIITPALMVGAFAERMKFSAMMLFSVSWLFLVYLPFCHMTWGPGGIFASWGVMDFAGGIVVHITAGVGALVACMVIGPRQGYPKAPMLPHNMTMCYIGTGMLWVGWYGFNGGSAVAADGTAAMAITVTQISAATAASVWMFVEWVRFGKPSVLGIATGAIAGLAAVTPASGSIGPIGGLVIGLASGFVCYFAATTAKQKLGYDDSLDVFGVHGVGGFIGIMLVAVFAAPGFGGVGDAEYSIAGALGTQGLAAVITIVYTAAVSWVLLKIVGGLVGLRVSDEEETQGLDVALHGESGYDY